MSIPKVPSSKSKDVGLAAALSSSMTSFDRANLVLKEIEHFLESELSETPQLSASYDTITRSQPKRKRPKLIHGLGIKRTRKTVGDMVFDPTTGVWVGNSEALKAFSAQPQLITSKTRADKSKSLGGMVWDPVAQKWIGNDPDLRLFEKRKVPLIAGAFKIKEFNGMTFDPVRMTWIGGDDDLPDFGISADASPVKDDGFVVGTEFELLPVTTQQFTECAERHRDRTAGWWREEKTRDYLNVIRTMSVMRMVRDVRRSVTSYYEEPSFMDIAPERDEPPLRSPREPETDFDDSWDDMGPFENAKLKLRDDSVDDLDAELDKLSKEDKEKKFASIGTRNSKPIETEDWDDDFEAEDLKVLPSKLNKSYKPIPNFNPSSSSPAISSPTPSITFSPSPNMTGTITNLSKGGSLNKKPFELLKSDAPHRRSFHLLPVEKKPTKIAWEDDDEAGLEIPTGPLRLKTSGDVATNAGADDAGIIDDDDDVPAQDFSNGVEEPEEVEEQDWDDVALPASLGDPVTKRAPVARAQPPEIEEWDDFEIPAEKLELKVSQQNIQQRHHKSSRAGRGGDDDDFDGIDIPEGMQLRLKR